jgi:AhpD family alkylhydroperoxidase
VVFPLLLLAMMARPPAPRPERGAAAGDGAARIPGVPESTRNPLVRYAFRETRRQTGRVATPIGVMAHAPGLLAGYGTFEMLTERAHRVPVRLKDLAVLKTAQLAGCEWCLDFGSAESRTHGVTDEELRGLLDHQATDVFSDLDKLVIDYAVAITRTPVDVLDEGQLVELTSVIALENYRARFNWAFGIGSEGFSEGAYCVPPQARQGAGAG